MHSSFLSLIFNNDPFYLASLLILLCLSLLSWTIILKQIIAIRKEIRQTHALLIRFSTSVTQTKFIQYINEYNTTLLSQAVQSTYHELKTLYKNDVITAKQSFTQINESLPSYIAVLMQNKSRSLPTLATISASAPFIGLFGTVSGMIRALYHIGGMNNVQLNIIAPDVSAALIATGVGLFVAIPALVSFNYFKYKEQVLLTLLNKNLFSIQILLHSLFYETNTNEFNN